MLTQFSDTYHRKKSRVDQNKLENFVPYPIRIKHKKTSAQTWWKISCCMHFDTFLWDFPNFTIKYLIFVACKIPEIIPVHKVAKTIMHFEYCLRPSGTKCQKKNQLCAQVLLDIYEEKRSMKM